MISWNISFSMRTFMVLVQSIFCWCVYHTTAIAQTQRSSVNITLHAITPQSCTIGIPQIDNGAFVSATMRLGTSPIGSSVVSILTEATISVRQPRLVLPLAPGTIYRLEAGTTIPEFPALCNAGIPIASSSTTFIHTPLAQTMPYISDARFVALPINPAIESNDSLAIIITGSATPLRRMQVSQAIDSVMAQLLAINAPLRDMWITEGNIDGCLGELPWAAPQAILIRLTRPDTIVWNSLRRRWITENAIFGPFIRRAPFAAGDIRQFASNMEFAISFPHLYQRRYYNFSTTATSARGTQQESGLALRMSPQPLSGAGLLTLTAQRPLTADIRVVNMLGQTVATLAQGRLFSIGETVLPCSTDALSSGVYAVQIVEQGRVLLTQAVVVAR